VDRFDGRGVRQRRAWSAATFSKVIPTKNGGGNVRQLSLNTPTQANVDAIVCQTKPSTF